MNIFFISKSKKSDFVFTNQSNNDFFVLTLLHKLFELFVSQLEEFYPLILGSSLRRRL